MMKKLIMSLVLALAFASLGFAATYTNWDGTATGYPYNDAFSTYLVMNEFDFTDHPVATSDVVQLIVVQTNSFVSRVMWQVVTNATAVDTCSFDLGDGDSATGWGSNIASTNETYGSSVAATSFTADIPATGSAVTVTFGAPSFRLGKAYSARDTIDLTSDGTITDGLIRVWAWITKDAGLPY